MISSRTVRLTIASAAALTVAVTTVGTADAAARPPAPFRNTRIVISKSEGGIAIGASKAAVENIFGAGKCDTEPNFGTTCDVDGPHNAYEVYAALNEKTNRLDELIFQTNPSYKPTQVMRTAKGIHLGSTLAQTKKAYPQLKKTVGPGPTTEYYAITQGHVTTSFVFARSTNKLYQLNLFSS